MVWRFFAIFLFAFALSASVSHAATSDFNSRFTPTSPPAATPRFSFQDSHNHVMDLHDFRGRYVLLNFWATWCGPCVREMPSLDALQSKVDGQKFIILAVTEDQDGVGAAEGFYKRHKLTHLPVLVDASGEIPHIMHVNGLPTSILIDPKGREIGRVEGDVDWDDVETVKVLQKQMTRATK
jgi:thiol-disulfide isomerase/thioredoxin